MPRAAALIFSPTDWLVMCVKLALLFDLVFFLIHLSKCMGHAACMETIIYIVRIPFVLINKQSNMNKLSRNSHHSGTVNNNYI